MSLAQPTNPYPQGIPVSGTGSSAPWATAWDPALGTYTANTGFGQAPIYTADQFKQWTSGANNFDPTFSLPGSKNSGFTAEGNWLGGQASYSPGAGFSISTPGGGTQGIQYKLDPATGYYIPASASGSSGGTSLIDNLIKYGAIGGGLAITGGGAAGLLGPGTVGAGAGALGGSAASGAAGFSDPAMVQAFLDAGNASSVASPIAGSEQASQGLSLLPATSPTSTAPLDPALAQQLGIDFSLGSAPAAGGPGFDASLLSGSAAGGGAEIPTIMGGAGTGGGGAGGFMGQLGSYLSNPSHLASLGLGGLSLAGALSKPQLPGQANTASAANTAASNAAQSVITGGGTASPNWAGQKSSIDASVAQELQDQSAALQQNAANTGQSGMVVQQQLNKLKQTLETQRQVLYEQAQRDNVNTAIAELTGSNQALMGISELQMRQDAAAQQASSQLAELALLLASKG